MAGNRLGRYEVIKTLARGAMTDLLVGRASGMEGFQRYVAIKLLRAPFAQEPRTFESFVSEARLAAVLHHHNIVQVHDIGEDEGRPYFAMEYVHGVDLRALLAKHAKMNQQLPLQHVVAIVASVAAALHHAHEQKGPDGQPLGIVHRDVSPGNVLVGFDGNVKVVDFGIAKAAIKQIQSDAGVLKGQAPYMSPEQCAGKPVDRRSDVFSLGIVLFELATVRRLFKGASEFLTMSAVCNAEVPKPSQYRRDIPAQLEAIMLKALSRDPSLRFQTAGEMSLALDKVATSVGVGASTTALANYMRLQFGDQREPWLAAAKRPVTEDDDDEYTEVTEVDFDGAASGLAPPHSEAVEKNAIPRAISASKSSPIVQMRTFAMTPSPDKPRAPLPPPTSKPTMKLPPKPPPTPGESALERAKTNVKRVDGMEPTLVEVDGPTELDGALVTPEPPPLPKPPVLSPKGNDASATAIVEPLPKSPTFARPPMPRRRSSSALWLMLAALFGGGGAIAAVVLWPGNELAPAAAPAPEVANVERPTPDETKPADEPKPTEPAKPEESRSGLQMTMADYERERAAQAAAAQAAETQKAEDAKKLAETKQAEETKKHEDAKKPDEANTEKVEPVAKKVAPPKRTTTKTPPKRTVTKVAEKPAKKTVKKAAAKKAKWNPDDLFLEDK